MFGQFYNMFRYSVEGGVLQSIGKETYADYHSEVNPYLVVAYTKNKHYRLPSLRLRAAVQYEVAAGWHAILRSGVNVRYLEYNTYGEYTNIVSVPITLGTELSLIKLGSKALVLGTGVGYSLMKIKTPPFERRGGLTTATDVAIQGRRFFYKLGYEYQQDNCSFDYDPAFWGTPAGIGVRERIQFQENRHQVFVGVGLKF